MRYLIVLLLSFLILIPSDGFSQITDVVYAIGNNDTMLKLVDGYWVPIVLDPGVFCGSLQEIWGSSSEDIYITGCDPGAVLHYDGISWQLLHVPDATLPIPDALMTVDGTGPDDIYVGGYECTGPEMDGVAYHWNGTDWTYIGGSGGIRRIWVDPGGGLYAITYKFDDVPVGGVYYYLLERYIDGGWSTVLSAPYEYFGCVGAFYNVSGHSADRPFVTGLFCHGYLGPGGIIYKKDLVWDDIPQDSECIPYQYCPIWPYYLYGIWCESDTDVWFAGENGMVMYWTPVGYTEYDTGVTETLRSIWGRSNSDVYAVGGSGRIVHFDGIDWTVMTTPTTNDLRDIWGLYEMPVATFLQSFSTDTDAGRITIHWSLSETDDNVEFRVSRSSSAELIPIVDGDPDLERNGLSFTYVDPDVEPGGDYTYLVEYSDGDVNEWIALFQTSRIVVPAASLALMPNYPNPFNPSTRITYSVPENGHVSLRIYDVSGKLVRTIVEKAQAPGTYSVNWNGLNNQGRNAATGAYFCRLVTAKQAITHKMLLTR